jgi:predicted SprT family Zn-dependent metalloprotease
MELNSEAEVRDALLHEIAHALAGHHAGHGPVWRKIAHEVGAKPKCCYRAEEVQQPPGRYLLVCPSCQESVVRYRRPSRVYACRSCCDRHNQGRFSERYRLHVRLLER